MKYESKRKGKNALREKSFQNLRSKSVTIREKSFQKTGKQRKSVANRFVKGSDGKKSKRFKTKSMIDREFEEESHDFLRSAPTCGRFNRMMKSYIKQAFAFILALSFRDFFDAILNFIVPFKEQPRYRLAFYTISLLLMIAITMLILVLLDSDME
jgi:hypothetical protein